MSNDIPDLKLIRHAGAINDQPDDLSYPFKLEVDLRPPSFMEVAFVLIYGGSEEIVVRGMTKESLDRFVDANRLRIHPRLRKLTITGPDGIMEQLPQPSREGGSDGKFGPPLVRKD